MIGRGSRRGSRLEWRRLEPSDDPARRPHRPARLRVGGGARVRGRARAAGAALAERRRDPLQLRGDDRDHHRRGRGHQRGADRRRGPLSRAPRPRAGSLRRRPGRLPAGGRRAQRAGDRDLRLRGDQDQRRPRPRALRGERPRRRPDGPGRRQGAAADLGRRRRGVGHRRGADHRQRADRDEPAADRRDRPAVAVAVRVPRRTPGPAHLLLRRAGRAGRHRGGPQRHLDRRSPQLARAGARGSGPGLARRGRADLVQGRRGRPLRRRLDGLLRHQLSGDALLGAGGHRARVPGPHRAAGRRAHRGPGHRQRGAAEEDAE